MLMLEFLLHILFNILKNCFLLLLNTFQKHPNQNLFYAESRAFDCSLEFLFRFDICKYVSLLFRSRIFSRFVPTFDEAGFFQAVFRFRCYLSMIRTLSSATLTCVSVSPSTVMPLFSQSSNFILGSDKTEKFSRNGILLLNSCAYFNFVCGFVQFCSCGCSTVYVSYKPPMLLLLMLVLSCRMPYENWDKPEGLLYSSLVYQGVNCLKMVFCFVSVSKVNLFSWLIKI